MNAFLFTGREWDQAAGLQYNRARWYGPTGGRFATSDKFWLNRAEAWHLRSQFQSLRRQFRRARTWARLRILDEDSLLPRRFLNLAALAPYAYVKGNPARFTDPHGFSSVSRYDYDDYEDQQTNLCALGFFLKNLAWLKYLGHWDGLDKFVHCLTSCQITRVCGDAGLAEGLGDLKEQWDEWIQNDSVEEADQVANQDGRDCAKTCPVQGCTDCCQGKYPHESFRW